MDPNLSRTKGHAAPEGEIGRRRLVGLLVLEGVAIAVLAVWLASRLLAR